MLAYKIPRLRIAIRTAFARILSCRFQINGIGMIAKIKSVAMFIPIIESSVLIEEYEAISLPFAPYRS